MNRKAWITLGVLFAALLVAAGARLLAGGWATAPGVWELRALRAGGAASVGAALGLAGVLLQCLLRNPLASPDLLGMASGAGLGVMVAELLAYFGGVSLGSGLGLVGTSTAALVGAGGALAIVLALSHRHGRVDPVWLVLVGVIVGVLAAAAMTLVAHFLPLTRRDAASRWMLGAIHDDLTWTQLASWSGATLIALAGGVRHAPAMDAMSLDDDEAASVGVRVSRVRLGLLLGAGVLTAASVVLAGPIGFVGLVCPHIVRLALGPGHRALVVGSALAGAILVLLADTAVRLVELPSGRLPVGVVTALAGGPVLITMLRRLTQGRLAGNS